MNSTEELQDGLVIETFDAQGKLVERYVGESTAELKYLHEAGECYAFCNFCYNEACETLFD